MVNFKHGYCKRTSITRSQKCTNVEYVGVALQLSNVRFFFKKIKQESNSRWMNFKLFEMPLFNIIWPYNANNERIELQLSKCLWTSNLIICM